MGFSNRIFGLFLIFLGPLPELCAAQVAQKSAPPILSKIRISQSAVNTRSAVLWIAQGQGFFARSGLDVETIYLRSSNLQMAAMATGDVQIGDSRFIRKFDENVFIDGLTGKQ
jgi:ABC-type nitrate/sulfonate/bicarbonate transport system substrate-binding protein